MPTISPPRTSIETRSSASVPSSRRTERLRAPSTTPRRSLVRGASVGRGGASPTISVASSSVEVFAASRSATSLPRRITAIRVASASTSLSLWLISTTVVPLAARARQTLNSSSVSCGVSTAVGSSSTSTRALRWSAFTISTFCCAPTESVSTRAVGSSWKPNLSQVARTSAFARSRSSSPNRRRLAPEHHVLGDGQRRHEHEVLVHHPDPQRGSRASESGSGSSSRRRRARPRPGW